MKYITNLLFIFLVFGLSAKDNKDIESFFHQLDNKQASLSFQVVDLNTKKELFSYNKGASLTPASILKLLTTATALETLGSDYCFKTILATEKNNPSHIIVHGYGDPTLGSKHFQGRNNFLNKWAGRIKKEIGFRKKITLSIIDNYFGYSGVSPKWIQEDLGNYFAAGAYGISVFDNTYKLYFNTQDIKQVPLIIKTVPQMDELIFENRLTYNYSGKDNGYIYGEPFSNKRLLTGDIPAKRSSFFLKGDIPNPGMVLGKSLTSALKAFDITVSHFETGRDSYFESLFSTAEKGFEEKTFYIEKSPMLKDIVRIVNVKSNNHYAEHIIRAIGRKANLNIYNDPLNEGINFIKNYWKKRGIDTKSMLMYDGCGLAPSNKISAETLCKVLTYMYTSKNSATFLASLPKAGQSGTVRYFCKSTRLEGKLFVKSGSIGEVQCFAGYYINGNQAKAFVILLNNYNSPRRQAVKAIQNLLLSTL